MGSITILRIWQVMARTGLSKSTIYAKIASGDFPEPINLGGRAVGWIADELEAWLVARVEATRGRTTQVAHGHEG